MEQSALEPQLSLVSLASVFADLHREFEPLAGVKSLNLVFPATSTVISTDRMLFARLLHDVLGNALKYMSAGTVAVTTSTDAESLVLSVDATGPGKPGDKLERLVDEYDPVDPSGTPRFVREVSRLLGYSVDVSSEVGAGTRVRIRVPLHRMAALSPTPDTDVPAPRKHHSPSRGRLVLLEDNDSVRAATELFLNLEGYETRSAGSVAEAETLLADLQPGDVLISDYYLDNRFTGLDILQQLRAQKRRDVPAVLLSGDLQSMMRVIKTAIPNCRFLGKPVDTAALLEAIEELNRSG